MHSHQHTQPLISVVVPLYKEEKNVPILVERLAHIFDDIGVAWELVFALDPGPDRTEEVIKELIAQDRPIRLLVFSRRIGKPLSLMAGLEYCAGDAVVVIDADLQDPPELIPTMIERWRDGYDVVLARRTSRKGERFLYLKAAEFFYKLLDKISEVQVPKNTGDFRLMSRRVVSEIVTFRERHGFLRGISAAVGFKTAIIDYDRDPRLSGKTHISLLGALNIALDGIVPFSRTPVRALFVLGVILGCLSLGAGITWAIALLVKGPTMGLLVGASMIFSGFMTAILLTSMGVLGEYLVRAYEEARDRPRYIISELVESATVQSVSGGKLRP